MSQEEQNVLSTYTAEDAVRDGLFIQLGTIIQPGTSSSTPIYATANAFVLAGLDDPLQRQGVIQEALHALAQREPEDTHWKLRTLHKGKSSHYECLWVVLNQDGVTIMMPEDY